MPNRGGENRHCENRSHASSGAIFGDFRDLMERGKRRAFVLDWLIAGRDERCRDRTCNKTVISALALPQREHGFLRGIQTGHEPRLQALENARIACCAARASRISVCLACSAGRGAGRHAFPSRGRSVRRSGQHVDEGQQRQVGCPLCVFHEGVGQ